MDMVKEKTRPENNAHCFDGVGRAYWLQKATGLAPADVRTTPEGADIVLDLDTDGFAVNNGGLVRPQETTMAPGPYFRFFGTIAHNRFGAAACMAGGWWIEPDHYFRIRSFARQHDVSLSRAACRLLVIPEGWHDCGYVGKAMLDRPLRAYVGRGKPASGGASPASALRDPRAAPVRAELAHLETKQWFVPGERALLSRFFRTEAVLACRKRRTWL